MPPTKRNWKTVFMKVELDTVRSIFYKMKNCSLKYFFFIFGSLPPARENEQVEKCNAAGLQEAGQVTFIISITKR
jgi:hypothetical protein